MNLGQTQNLRHSLADLAKVHGNFVSFLILCIIPNMIDDQGGFFTLVIDFFDNRFQHTSFD